MRANGGAKREWDDESLVGRVTDSRSAVPPRISHGKRDHMGEPVLLVTVWLSQSRVQNKHEHTFDNQNDGEHTAPVHIA